MSGGRVPKGEEADWHDPVGIWGWSPVRIKNKMSAVSPPSYRLGDGAEYHHPVRIDREADTGIDVGVRIGVARHHLSTERHNGE